MIYLTTPIDEETIAGLHVGDVVSISGWIYTGRDAVLPKVQECIANQTLADNNISLQGSVIFHTAVSPAGIGPTSSNKKRLRIVLALCLQLVLNCIWEKVQSVRKQ